MIGGPSLKTLLFGSGPRFMRDAFGATIVFYAGWKLHGLLLGVVAATVWTVAVYVWERKHERPGIAARIGLAIALVQAGAALASQSAIGYFAPPVIINAVYGLAFLGSVADRPPARGGVRQRDVPAAGGDPGAARPCGARSRTSRSCGAAISSSAAPSGSSCS